MLRSFIPAGCLLLLLLLLPRPDASGHTGSIRGVITSSATGRPVEGASIFIGETGLQASSDVFGAFFIRGLPEGHYTVSVTALGYAPVVQKVRIEDGVTAELPIGLEQGSVQLRDVTVSHNRDVHPDAVSGLDLQLRPVNTAQDLLRLVPGLFISQHQGGGKAEQIFLRGFDVDHGTDVSVRVDGMPVNMVSHAHGQGYADLHFLIPELVDQMSFGKGPYQIDRGNLATAGWIDFRTRNYLDNSFVKVEGGMYGYYRTLVAVDLLGKAAAARNEGAYLAGEYAFNRGYFDVPQDFSRINLTGKYTRQLGGSRLFSATVSGFRSAWDASGQIPERAVAGGLIGRFGQLDPESGATSRYHLNLQLTQSVNRNTAFKTNLYAGYYDFGLYSNFTFFLHDSVNGDQIHQQEKRFFSGYNADYTIRYSLGKMAARTVAGLGFRYDNTANSELSHTLNRSVTLERLAYGDIRETNAFGYIEQAVYLLPSLVLHGGTRFDYFIHDYDDRLAAEPVRRQAQPHAFSPKAGIYYNFGKEGRVYFNYGTGFHSNDTRVVVPQQGHGVLPLAHSADLGILLKPTGRLLVSGAVFLLDLDQEFVYVGDEAVVEAGGRTRRMGVDGSVRLELMPWLFLDADVNYTYARARDAAEGSAYIPLAPSLTSIGGITYKGKGPFTGSLRYRFMGDRPANEDNTLTARGYTVVDAALNYVRPRYEFGLQIQNLFNTDWAEAQFDTETRLRHEAAAVPHDICFTPGTPFFLKVSATYKF